MFQQNWHFQPGSGSGSGSGPKSRIRIRSKIDRIRNTDWINVFFKNTKQNTSKNNTHKQLTTPKKTYYWVQKIIITGLRTAQRTAGL